MTTTQAANTPPSTDSATDAPDRPIFIVGCARSGTTLLSMMLHAHPRLSMPPETRFVIAGYYRRHHFGDLRDPANHRRLADWIVGSKATKFADLKLDAERTRQAILSAPPTLGTAFGVVFREFALRFGKPRWGDKRPLYIDELPMLLRLFPDAQVVHIIRDGRDCVASLKHMPWWGQGTIASARKWKRAIQAGHEARRTLRPDQYHELRYEDLVAQPEDQLRKLCVFLGEAFDPAMLQHQEAAQVAVPDHKMAWHARTRQSVDEQAVGKWKQDLEPWELALIETAAADELRQWGYAPSTESLSPPLPVRLRYSLHALRSAWEEKRKAARDRRRLVKNPWPLAARLTRGQLDLPMDC